MRFPGWMFFALCVSLTWMTQRIEADDDLMPIGVAKMDITPAYPIRMTGYQGRDHESEGVEQLLWAKALAFGSDEAGPAVLITLDNCQISEAITAEVAKRLEKKAHVTRERLAICASHTHCGPCISGTLPLMFAEPLPVEHQERIDRYTREMTNSLEQVALKALADRKPAKLSWSQGELKFAMNRRIIKAGVAQGMARTGNEGVVDHDFPMLRVTDADGKLRAVLVNYACHGVTLGPDFMKLCGDWIGYAQSIIEADHPGVIALVAIGCGADANPEPRTKLAHAMRQGIDVGREVDRLLTGEFRPITGPLVCRLKYVSLAFDTLPTREELVTLSQGKKNAKQFHAQTMLAQLDRGEPLPKDISYPIQTWTFGNDLAMVFLGGEVVADYSLRLKKELDGSRLWVNAYSNDVPCYIASRRVIGEGGYEVLSSMYYYGKPTQFKPEIEDTIVNTVKEMLPPEWKAKP